jgi:hypothetical protein
VIMHQRSLAMNQTPKGSLSEGAQQITFCRARKLMPVSPGCLFSKLIWGSRPPYSANILSVRSQRGRIRFVAERGVRSGGFGQADLVWDL